MTMIPPPRRLIVHPDEIDDVRSAYERRRAADLFCEPLDIIAGDRRLIDPGQALLLPGDRPPVGMVARPCPNDPGCEHAALSHDIVELGDPMPLCAAPGCGCGRP